MSIIRIESGGTLAVTSGGTVSNGPVSFSPLDITTGSARFWYDFSDKSNMHQDESRTTLVAADGDEIHSMNNKFDITGLGGVTTAGEPYATRHTVAGSRAIWRDATSDPNPTDKNVHGDFTATGPTTGLRANVASDVMTDGVDTWTAFAVFPVTPSTLSSSIIRKVAFTGMTNGGNFMGVFGTDSESNEIGIRAGSTFVRSPTLSLGVADQNKWIQQTVVFDTSAAGGTVLRWRLNGTDDISNLSGTTGVGTFTWRRGLQMADRGTFDWIGNLGEIIIYKDQVSDSEIAAMEGYLAAKWNLTTL